MNTFFRVGWWWRDQRKTFLHLFFTSTSSSPSSSSHSASRPSNQHMRNFFKAHFNHIHLLHFATHNHHHHFHVLRKRLICRPAPAWRRFTNNICRHTGSNGRKSALWRSRVTLTFVVDWKALLIIIKSTSKRTTSMPQQQQEEELDFSWTRFVSIIKGTLSKLVN